MQIYTFAATGRQIDAPGNYIRYERETGGAVDASVRVRVDGSDYGVWLPGDFVQLETRSSRIEIVPVSTAVGEFRIGSGFFNSSRFLLTGQPTTNIGNNKSAQANFTNTQKTVTNASAQLLAANANREYLLIQNNDATGYIVVTFGAAAATLTTGIRIAAGGFWEWDSCAPVDAVQAIGVNGSNSSIIVVEGQ